MADEQRRGPSALTLILLPLFGAGLYFGIRLAFRGPEAERATADQNPFDVAEAPGSPEPAPLPEPSAAPPPAPGAKKTGPGLPGFVPESDTLFVRKPSAKDGRSPASAAEREFLRKHGATIARYTDQVLVPISDKYKKDPVVREVDGAFGRLPRYMALKDRYRKDGNVYAWARDTIALPEVRQTLMRFAKRPEVWRVGIQMSMEGLRRPPPKPVYDEMKRFLTSDDKMTEFIGDLSSSLIPHAGRLATQSIPPGTDITQLKNLAATLAPGAAAKSAPPPRAGKQGRRS